HTRFSRDWSSDVCSSDLYLVRRVAYALAVVHAPFVYGVVLGVIAAPVTAPCPNRLRRVSAAAFYAVGNQAPALRGHGSHLRGTQLGNLFAVGGNFGVVGGLLALVVVKQFGL